MWLISNSLCPLGLPISLCSQMSSPSISEVARDGQWAVVSHFLGDRKQPERVLHSSYYYLQPTIKLSAGAHSPYLSLVFAFKYKDTIDTAYLNFSPWWLIGGGRTAVGFPVDYTSLWNRILLRNLGTSWAELCLVQRMGVALGLLDLESLNGTGVAEKKIRESVSEAKG